MLHALFLLLGVPSAFADDTTLPTGKGLPVIVRTGVYFLDVEKVDDTNGTFDATIDVRLIWDDLRLQYPAAEAPAGFKEYRAEAADQKLTEIWSPQIMIGNLSDDAAFEIRGLRIFPSGKVEWMQRTKGQFTTSFDVTRFPFDKQYLSVDLMSRREPNTKLLLDFRQSELDFSRHAKNISVDGWEIGTVDIRRHTEWGWHGDVHSQVSARLQVLRDPAQSIPPIFIPLFASLLIPLLALWLNQAEKDGEFKVEAFELTNVLIGGLFALIALNFTINSTYPMLAAGNPVSLFFSLNYVVLAANLAINIGLMRFGLVKRWFGPHVQREVYAYTVWALPASVVVASAAILLTAMA